MQNINNKNMLYRWQKIMAGIFIGLVLVGFSIPQFSQAQEAETTTNPNVLEATPQNVSNTDFDGAQPNAVEPTAGSAGPSIMKNLQFFGDLLGMKATDPRAILARLVKSALSLLGIIVLVLILWSGLKYMMAGGDEERAKNARSTFVNTLIGLFIILAAYSIVNFVFGALTGAIVPIDNNSAPVSPANPDPVVNP